MITGEMNLLMSTSGIALIPGYYRFLRGEEHAPGWAIGTFSVATLIFFLFDSMVISEDVFIAVAHLTIAFQAIKSFDLKEPWDHLQVYFMSLLQLIIASELTYSIAFGGVFMVFMALLVTAMVLSHFLKEGQIGKIKTWKPIYLISILTLLVTSFFFIALPRINYRFLGKAHARVIRTVGFTDKVDFGSFGNVKLDPTVAMRIEVDKDVPSPYYWRGASLNYFDGHAWKNSLIGKSRVAKVENEFLISPYDKLSAVEQKIYLEPIDSDILFGLAEIKGVKTASYSLLTDSNRDVHFFRKATRGEFYTVYSILQDSYAGSIDPSYLDYPRSLGKIAALAKKITADAGTDLQKAMAIEEYLKNNYTYSLSTSRPSAGSSPLEEFIFNTKKGFCEHYAASMVIMLRSTGVPSRIVTGFLGGEKNAYGGYIIIRRSDAHSWVEAIVDNKWKRFDPTPEVVSQRPSLFSLLLDSVQMNWSRHIIGFNTSDQKKIFQILLIPFNLPKFNAISISVVKTPLYFFFGFTLFLCLIFLLLKIMRINRYGFVTEKYLVLRKKIKKEGISVSLATTTRDIRKMSVNLTKKREVEEFLSMYERFRFGQIRMDIEDKKRYASLLEKIKKG